MAKFRKKPVVIEAFQFDLAADEFPAWAKGIEIHQFENPPYAHIKTLEGVMRADHFDWIIQGIKGEIYPCKPDIFAATYEPVT